MAKSKAKVSKKVRLQVQRDIIEKDIDGRKREIARTRKTGRQHPGYLSSAMMYRLGQLEKKLSQKKRRARGLTQRIKKVKKKK